MDKFEKIKRVLNGEFTGEVPFSFWTHLPAIDRQPEKIAQATYSLFKKYDLDLLKTLNNGMYATEDYGCQIDFSEVATGGVAKIVESPIQTYDDWQHLPELTIANCPALQRELRHLKRLVELVDGEAPILMTVFSPLTIADKLTKGKIADHIQADHSGFLLEALEKIARLTGELAREALRLGASGIYFANQLASYDVLSRKTYQTYGRPFDIQVLSEVQGAWLNAIHVHGNNIMFDVLSDYPVQLFNWHVWESLPEPKEAQFYTGKAILGGLNRMDITNGQLNQLHHQIYRIMTETAGKGLILSPGCVIRHPFSDEVIDYILEVKQKTESLLLENSSLNSSRL